MARVTNRGQQTPDHKRVTQRHQHDVIYCNNSLSEEHSSAILPLHYYVVAADEEQLLCWGERVLCFALDIRNQLLILER